MSRLSAALELEQDTLLRALGVVVRTGASTAMKEAAQTYGRRRAAEGADAETIVGELKRIAERVFDIAERIAPCLSIADARTITSALSACVGDALAVHESHSLLRVVVDSVPFLVSYVTADERYGMVNAAYEEWFGIEARDIVGQKTRDVIGERAADLMSPQVRRCLAGERFEFEQHGLPYRLGGTRDVRVRFTPHFDEEGTVRGCIALLEDVTTDRQTERALGLAESRLQFVLQSGRMGTWDLDLANGYLATSDTCKANFGRGPADTFTYDELAASVLEEDRAGWRARVDAAVESCSDLDVEYRARWLDGSVHWVHVRASCMADRTGKTTSLSGISLLIDRRKAIEEELRIADRRKDEFLATASHELRTPLNAILGWATMLRADKIDDDKRRKGAATIERSARSQVKLIDDILDGARMLSGKLRLEVGPLDLTEIVRAAAEVVRPAALAKNIELSVALDQRVGAITGDAERLQQVVWNLVINAIKFTPKGGSVDVSLAPVGSSVELRVADSGQGIDADFLPHVFERFRQADGSTTRRHGGLGLGLALVHHLVTAHGGHVAAESGGEGQGSTFIVTLPIRAVAGSSERTVGGPGSTRTVPPRVWPSLAGVTALVVDDEPDARELVATLLRTAGADVTMAGSAKEAIAAFLATPSMVVVSDIGMPNTDGYAFVHLLRTAAGAEGARVPAIALSAYAREDDRTRALTAGFQDYLCKPVDAVDLLEMVARLVT